MQNTKSPKKTESDSRVMKSERGVYTTRLSVSALKLFDKQPSIERERKNINPTVSVTSR